MKYEPELVRTDESVPEFLTRGSSSSSRLKRISPLRGMQAHNRLAVHVPSPHANGAGNNGRNGKAKAHKRMDPEAYEQLVHRIREVVRAAVPPASTIVVVSRGDYRLVNFDGFTCWHFPQNEEGVYGGYHPASGQIAVAHLEALRARGGRYLLLPSTAFWWLDFYPEFREHLQTHSRLVMRQEDTCILYELPQTTALVTVGEERTPAAEADQPRLASDEAETTGSRSRLTKPLAAWRRWFGRRHTPSDA
jgi:hypothetical protein